MALKYSYDRRFPSLVYNKVWRTLPDRLSQKTSKTEQSTKSEYTASYNVRGRDADGAQIELEITIIVFQDSEPLVRLSALTAKGYFDSGTSDEDFDGAHWKPAKEMIKGDDEEFEVDEKDPEAAADMILAALERAGVKLRGCECSSHLVVDSLGGCQRIGLVVDGASNHDEVCAIPDGVAGGADTLLVPCC